MADLHMQFSVDPACIGQISMIEQRNIQRLGVIQHLQSGYFGCTTIPVTQNNRRELRKLHAFHSLSMLLQQGNQICLCSFMHHHRIHVQRHCAVFRSDRLFIVHIHHIDRIVFQCVAVHTG